MLVQYFNQDNLAYASRRRYNTFNYLPFNYEEQNAIKLGDGATTSIKTSKDNICNYVTIDDTRWFVTSYIYKNGGQVELFLQRDVIGEFGLSGCYGRIDRGITNSILRNRKELSLNQILKKRSRLIPETTIYGNYFIDTHENERWGIIYLVKPSDGSENVTINIPEFAIKETSYLPLISQKRYYLSNTYSGSDSFIVAVGDKSAGGDSCSYYNCSLKIDNDGSFYFDISFSDVTGGSYIPPNYKRNCVFLEPVYQISATTYNVVSEYLTYVKNSLNGVSGPINKSNRFPIDNTINNYTNGSIIKENNSFYRVNISQGTYATDFSGNNSDINEALRLGETITIQSLEYKINYVRQDTMSTTIPTVNNNATIIRPYEFSLSAFYKDISFSQLSSSEAGLLELNLSKDLIDEPYVIYVFPLYNCTITNSNDNSERFEINSDYAFNVFNTVVQYLSGQSGYIVDAQIYPYCPYLTEVATNFKGLPFFNILSTSFDRLCTVDLQPFVDVKKEYISRQYSIVSPDQSDKFTFNFYDYKTSVSTLDIIIRTALKPFAIISSAVIQIDAGALKGINYDSELIGCQPSSNGFEVSLSTNQYQEYMRNNSNYEKIFNKNQEYLKKQHEVEQKNEEVSRTANTVSAAIMGAIGGASLGSSLGGIKGPALGAILGGVGAGVGGFASGKIVNDAMTEQIEKNKELRDYELSLQKELFDLNIGTVKNLPNTISRISSFNEVIMKDFWFVVETYECSEEELRLVDEFINRYSYSIGVYSYFYNYSFNGRFIKGSLLSSSYFPNLHNIANKELTGGIYYYGS